LLLLERGMPGITTRQMQCSGVWPSGTTCILRYFFLLFILRRSRVFFEFSIHFCTRAIFVFFFFSPPVPHVGKKAAYKTEDPLISLYTIRKKIVCVTISKINFTCALVLIIAKKECVTNSGVHKTNRYFEHR
jgi:hypothetical protein